MFQFVRFMLAVKRNRDGTCFKNSIITNYIFEGILKKKSDPVAFFWTPHSMSQLASWPI